MSTEVVMPQMGESIAEGTITKWLKQVGERVERDEPLFEISTDKVDAEIPSPAAGTLTEIKFKEGETVEVNTVVAVLDGGGGGAAGGASGGGETKVSAPASPQPASPASQAAVSAPTPPLPPAPPAAPAPPPQQTSAPQAPSTRQAAQPVSTPATQPAATAQEQAGGRATPQPSAQASTTSPASTTAAGGNGREQTVEELRRTRSSPLVRNIAREHGIDISRLEGTGASGRVTKNDILSFIESGAAMSPAGPRRSRRPDGRQAQYDRRPEGHVAPRCRPRHDRLGDSQDPHRPPARRA